MKLKSDKYKSGEKALSRKEYEKLISVIDNTEDELLIKFAVSTGLRREDLCAVRLGNIDLENGTLTFHEKKKRIDRTIYLNTDVVLLIKKFVGNQKRERLFRFTGRSAYRHFNRWCVVAGIPERPFHSLRATCIKFCQQAGWMPEQVSKLTGDSIRVIQEHYLTPSDGDMREVVRTKSTI